jgi:hypothetical protein
MTVGIRRKIVFIAVGLFIALAASTQEAETYRSIAVMDFRFSGITQEQMNSVVDRLSLEILKTQAIRRVVSREQREQLIRESGGNQRRGSYEKKQLHNATIIEVELAVLGEIRKEGNLYRLELRLLEVDSAESLFSDQRSYTDAEELLQDADRLASVLVRVSRQPRIVEPDNDDERRERKRELETVAGLRIGHEASTAAPGIDGGSHLYAEVLAELNRVFAVSLKYSVGLFPVYSENHLIAVLPRVNIRLAEELYTAISAGYLMSTDYRGKPHHYLGARLSPIHSGNIGGISLELLPLSVFFDLDGGKPVFIFELLAIAFWLPLD